MKLVIVESPAKCKKIENYLGNGYKCVASFGHITGIINGLKDIDIANGFKPLINVPSHLDDVIEIAKLELQQKKTPFIIKNTTRFHNEILKQRLGCIPVHITDPEGIENLQIELNNFGLI